VPELLIRDRAGFSTDELRTLGRWLAVAFDEPADAYRPETWEELAPGPHLLIEHDGALLAHACLTPVPIEAGGWTLRSWYVELVATRADVRGRGYGTTIMRAAAPLIEANSQLGLLSTGTQGFYERLAWIRWTGPTSVTEADGTVTPTPEEDDSIMALFVPGTPAEITPDLLIRRSRRDPFEAW
jgi:aminoglycoside 2'-N-acetyltransferase I